MDDKVEKRKEGDPSFVGSVSKLPPQLGLGVSEAISKELDLGQSSRDSESQMMGGGPGFAGSNVTTIIQPQTYLFMLLVCEFSEIFTEKLV